MQKFICKTFRLHVKLIAFFCALFSCSDVFERDLSCDRLEILTPLDSARVLSGVVQFKWRPVDEALNYELEIATPSFQNPELYVADTSMGSSQFNLALNQGEYEWRVRASNAGSESPWSSQILYVDSTAGLDGIQLNIISPSDGFLSANSLLEFEWQDIASAEYYTWQLLYDNQGEVGDIFTSDQPSNNALVMTIPDGHWLWRVQGEVFGASPSNFDQHYLIVDTTDPEPAEPLAPIGTVETTNLVSFSWVPGEDLVTGTNETIRLYSDENGSNLVLTEIVNGSSATIDLVSLNTGVYYWQVRTQDEAGNFSSSELVSFTFE